MACISILWLFFTLLTPAYVYFYWRPEPHVVDGQVRGSYQLHECEFDEVVDWEFYYSSRDFFHYEIANNRPRALKVREVDSEICSLPKESEPQWTDCLPINPVMDPKRCTLASRTELLKTDPAFVGRPCMAAILDMLLIEVNGIMLELGCEPLLTFGTALGAWRNGTHIPHTDDIDLAYIRESDVDDCLDERFASLLRSRGFYTFRDELIRVCIAPFHPLASNLYDINNPKPCGSGRSCGYVDIYPMVPYTGNKPYHREGKLYRHVPYDGYRMSEDQIWPLRPISINARNFNTFGDVEDLLQRSYGKDFLHPKGNEEYMKDLGIVF
ncbi:AP-1 complex subunit sigma-1A [Perkinsus chesapeaki]|uniref:AP-1 complex subunit sigma-1A n=1 Tax=Perkinsus chesapeaki TaxID=330153 RepID=A0A7J6LH98_PERCH|nr:AP-1 complex subunit sigma-1A [Perkinsus chesapeaki]